jgi:hypothetical protein
MQEQAKLQILFGAFLSSPSKCQLMPNVQIEGLGLCPGTKITGGKVMSGKTANASFGN